MQPGRSRLREMPRERTLLASCTECGRLHKPECPLSLSPICAPCTGRYAMTSLKMSAACPLEHAEVDAEVTRLAPGGYALGSLEAGRFVPFFVGRADADVNEELHAWVGRDGHFSRYTHFAFCYALSAEAAFHVECASYHDFGGSYGLDNERHPAPTRDAAWHCPASASHSRRESGGAGNA
jgi:hypothetical protein